MIMFVPTWGDDPSLPRFFKVFETTIEKSQGISLNYFGNKIQVVVKLYCISHVVDVIFVNLCTYIISMNFCFLLEHGKSATCFCLLIALVSFSPILFFCSNVHP